MRQTADGDDAGRRKISNSRSTLPKGEKGDGQGKASRQPSHAKHIQQATSALSTSAVMSITSAVSAAVSDSTRPPTPYGTQA